MVKPIVRDAFFLNQRSEEATKADLPVAQDLEDTLKANREHCVGMAANMIGCRKRIIIVATGFADMIMINPVITAKFDPYEAEEADEHHLPALCAFDRHDHLGRRDRHLVRPGERDGNAPALPCDSALCVLSAVFRI